MNVNKSFVTLIFVIVLVTFSSLMIYSEFTKTKNHIFQIIKEYLISEKIYVFGNYVAQLEKRYEKNFVTTVLNNKDIANNLEDALSLIKEEDVKYLYILFKDSDGKFRYLVDATEGSEKAFIKQKFDVESKMWEQAYISKKYQIRNQEKLESLWVTIAYPIIINNQVVAVIGADFTYDVYIKILHILLPMEDIFLYIRAPLKTPA